MTLKIEVGGKLEAALNARASEQGVSADSVARRVLAQALTPEDRETGPAQRPEQSGEEKTRAFVLWAESHRPTPPLSDEAISRGSLNPDRW